MRLRWLAPLAFLPLAGCGVIYKVDTQQGNLFDKATVESLQPGMSKRQVLLVMGSPAVISPFNQDRWDYVATRRTGRTGPTVVKNMTLWFENGSLNKWEGEYFPEEDSELAKTMSRFGNLPKDKKKGGR